MKKILVTGASGFIGKALTKYLLDQDTKVFAIVRDSETMASLSHYANLFVVECEMSDYKHLSDKITERDFDICYHLAWEGVSGQNCQNLEIQLSNIKASLDLLSSLKFLNTRSLIFMDTISQYKYIGIESGINKNFDLYGIAKQTTSKILVKQASEMDMNVNSVMFPNIYGNGDYSKRSTNIIIDNFLKNKIPNLADGAILYDWVYIDDAISAIAAVAEKGRAYKSYYIGHRKLKTLQEIITTVRDVVNPSIPLTFGTYHDISFIDYDQFFNDDLYQDTGFEIGSNFEENIKKTMEWVKTLNF